ncbi:hypothetical protein Clacol_003558 [Clathrus columnatus]|uniref:Uncharacterized protein n=1 Tax=Clathrus columnatus TaxID=1419009 RepID=A0AAV5A9X3_9AGAM|nr:hypothetical protein Clacol_003558 [Clathrus columnatus]
MGANQSNEKVVYNNETSIQFSQDLVNHLADSQASPETTPAQQSVLDAHVRARIQNEISRLRAEEEEVKQQIETALERENIDKERSAAGSESSGEGGDEGPDGVFRSSESLREDLEIIQKKVERFHRGSSLEDVPEIKETKERLVECYKNNQSTSLNCWKEVVEFKESVQRAEHLKRNV